MDRTSITRLTCGYGLDESAAGTLARWSFEPGMRDGKPVKVDMLTEFGFCLY